MLSKSNPEIAPLPASSTSTWTTSSSLIFKVWRLPLPGAGIAVVVTFPSTSVVRTSPPVSSMSTKLIELKSTGLSKSKVITPPSALSSGSELSPSSEMIKMLPSLSVAKSPSPPVGLALSKIIAPNWVAEIVTPKFWYSSSIIVPAGKALPKPSVSKSITLLVTVDKSSAIPVCS